MTKSPVTLIVVKPRPVQIATADTHVVSWTPTTNYGSSREALTVSSPRRGEEALIYLRFPIGGLDITKNICITMYVLTSTYSGVSTLRFHPIIDAWEEMYVTWNTKPRLGDLVGYVSAEKIPKEKWVSFVSPPEVTRRLIKRDSLEVCLRALSETYFALSILTRETAYKPHLKPYT